jgi:high-affinity iron transporter
VLSWLAWRWLLGVACLLVTGPAWAAAGAAPSASASVPAAPAARAQTILHMLDYVAVDYPEAVKDGKILAQSEYEEQIDFVTQVRVMLGELPAQPARAGLSAQADELLLLVHGKRSGAEVAAAAHTLRTAIVKAYDVEVAPRRPPDLAAASALYAARCASCHGADGRGDGPAGQGLDPRPSDFHDAHRMDQRSVHGLYNTISLGVAGTAMAAFDTLPADQRWALAFFVAGLGTPGGEVARGEQLWRSGRARAILSDLASVATATTADIRSRGGDEAASVLAFLRSRPDLMVSAETPLARSRRVLRESVEAYQAGRGREAADLAVSAYLDGFEPVEPSLDAVDPKLRVAIENEMTRYRAMLRAAEPAAAVEAQAHRIGGLLDEARERLSGPALPAAASFTSALIILLREGLEAILIVAAIMALLVKAGRRDALPYIHAGWIAALALGMVTWLVASYVVAISGATREVTEGVTALVAAGVLLYVGFWMHSKAYASRWRAYLEQRLRGALSSRTLWALALVSFLAVYREAFETVLFAEALWLQAGPSGRSAALGGFGVAAVLLVALGWLITRGSLRLPLGVFFGGTAALLALLAVVFAGQGVAALQEAGVLPASPVSFVHVPLLGLYPTAQGLLIQAGVIALIVAGFLYSDLTARRTA